MTDDVVLICDLLWISSSSLSRRDIFEVLLLDRLQFISHTSQDLISILLLCCDIAYNTSQIISIRIQPLVSPLCIRKSLIECLQFEIHLLLVAIQLIETVSARVRHELLLELPVLLQLPLQILDISLCMLQLCLITRETVHQLLQTLTMMTHLLLVDVSLRSVSI